LNIEQVDHVLGEIAEKSGAKTFVIIGSLSILWLMQEGKSPPQRMLISNEVDGFPESDPGMAVEFTKDWGPQSEFYKAHGYYFDAVNPSLPTLPDGWRSRLIPMRRPSGLVLKFLDPNDAAVSKYARGEAKDREWIREGIRASILSIPTIEYRFRETLFVDQKEHELAKAALAEDVAWYAALRSSPNVRPRKPRRGAH
jgi:hypothetical protein